MGAKEEQWQCSKSGSPPRVTRERQPAKAGSHLFETYTEVYPMEEQEKYDEFEEYDPEFVKRVLQDDPELMDGFRAGYLSTLEDGELVKDRDVAEAWEDFKREVGEVALLEKMLGTGETEGQA